MKKTLKNTNERYTLREILLQLVHPPRKDSSTVKKAFPFVFAALIVLGAAVNISNPQTSYISIEPDREYVKAGTDFSITVSAYAHVPTNAIDIQISYPKERIKIIGLDTGQSVITLWTEEPYAKDSVIYLRGGVFRKGFLGKHQIIKIKARAIESGTAIISAKDVTFLAGDGKGSRVAIDKDAITTSIQISNDEGSIVGRINIDILTDLNGDGEVTLTDIYIFMSAWRNSDIIFDFNGDGRMTFTDFAILLSDSFFR